MMEEEKVYKAKLKVKYVGKNKLFLHEQIGEGILPDGRKCRLIMLNNAILMEVTLGKDEWEHYSVNWMDLSEAISSIIPKQQFDSSLKSVVSSEEI